MLGAVGAAVWWTLLFWVAFFACLKFLNTYFGGQLGEWLASAGIDLRPGYVRWYTRTLNPWFARVGFTFPTFLRLWYGLGAVLGCLAMACSLVLLVFNLYWSLNEPDQPPVLTPVVPGVNVPTSHLAYYVIALALAGVLHEIGHALAATSEHVQVNGFGVFLVILYPGAFVDLPEESLLRLPPAKLLRIYCAGAWHNIALSVACVAVLWCLPLLLSPFYSTGLGALVTHVPEDSPFVGHVAPGHRVVALGECPVSGLRDWSDCIHRWSYYTTLPTSSTSTTSPPHRSSTLNSGFCLNISMVARLHRNHGTECCRDLVQGNEMEGETEKEGSTNLMCFHLDYDPPNNESQMCGMPRQVGTNAFCAQDERCRSKSPGFVCARPVTEEHHAVVKITLDDSSFLLYYGQPYDLWWSFIVSDYVPRKNLIPAWLPAMIEKTLRYTASLSGGLAVINMAPIQWLDGQWAASACLSLLLPAATSARRDRILRVLSTGTAVLFLANVLVSLGQMFIINNY